MQLIIVLIFRTVVISQLVAAVVPLVLNYFLVCAYVTALHVKGAKGGAESSPCYCALTGCIQSKFHLTSNHASLTTPLPPPDRVLLSLNTTLLKLTGHELLPNERCCLCPQAPPQRPPHPARLPAPLCG